jgi:hypothetical protein
MKRSPCALTRFGLRSPLQTWRFDYDQFFSGRKPFFPYTPNHFL